MTTPDFGTEGMETGAVGTEQDTRDKIRQAKDKVVDQARDTLRSAKDRAAEGLGDTRRQAADQIGGIAGAFRRTGEQLRGEQQDRFADLADSVGQRVDSAADYVRRSDGRTIARDLEGLARRQPALVFAGAFALGVIAARFLRSSAPESSDRSFESESYDDAGLRGRGGYDAPA